MNNPWNDNNTTGQNWTSTVKPHGQSGQIPGASGAMTVTGTTGNQPSVTYKGVAASAVTWTASNSTLQFNVQLPTGNNGANQNWHLSGTFNGTVSPATISGGG